MHDQHGGRAVNDRLSHSIAMAATCIAFVLFATDQLFVGKHRCDQRAQLLTGVGVGNRDVQVQNAFVRLTSATALVTTRDPFYVETE